MSYNKHTWVNNVDAVDETKMNNIENGIKDLDDNKVNKSGDTLTGELLFKNTDDFAAIRKNRTLNGTDYQLTVGLGTNGSARMEYADASKVLGSIEVRSNGVYNGVSGKKLAEQSNGWTNATLSQNVKALIRYFKVGKMVVVQIQDLNFSVNVSHNFIFATGLPKSITYTMGILIGFDSPGKVIRVAATAEGQIVSHYSNVSGGTGNYYGYLIYIAQD